MASLAVVASGTEAQPVLASQGERSSLGRSEARNCRGFASAQLDRPLLGLPHVLVKGLGDHGQKFMFDTDEWSMLVAKRVCDWRGKQFYIVQCRGNEQIWMGRVTVHSGNSTTSFGKCDFGTASAQWEINDYVMLAADVSVAGSAWHLEDSIQLGKADWMFDSTVVRLDPDSYPSTSAVIKGLDKAEITCSQGICICFSQTRQLFFLVCRSDQKDVGLRLFEELKRHYPDRGSENFPRVRSEAIERGMVSAGRVLPQSSPCCQQLQGTSSEIHRDSMSRDYQQSYQPSNAPSSVPLRGIALSEEALNKPQSCFHRLRRTCFARRSITK